MDVLLGRERWARVEWVVADTRLHVRTCTMTMVCNATQHTLTRRPSLCCSGNNEFFLHGERAGDTPDKCEVGSWRSHNVEMMQIKRKLQLGFEVVPGTEPICLQACGPDASTPFIPDGVCRVNLSHYIWEPHGMNHGRTAYKARQAHDSGIPTHEEPMKVTQPSYSPMVYALIGALAGIACTAIVMRR